MLYCSDGTYYTGVTNDLERRLFEHEIGFNKKSYTFSRRPLKLVYYEIFNDYLLAIDWETKIKKWSSKKKEALSKSNWDRLRKESECINASTHKEYKKQEFGKNN